MPINPNPKPYRPGRQNKPRFDFGHKPWTPSRATPQKKPEEKHFWSAQQWEDWATSVYEENPDAELPDWFIEYMEAKNEYEE